MVITLVAWAGIITAVLIAFVVVQLLVVRAVDAARRQRKRSTEETWLPILVACVERVPESLPQLALREVPTFLALWNHVQVSLLDDAKERLNVLARRVGAETTARKLLVRGRVSERLLAITTLGQLKDRGAWDLLVYYARATDQAVSLAAACALMRIDAPAAIDHVGPLIAKREDWPPSAVVAMLQEAGGETISGPLADAAANARPGRAHRLIRYLEIVHTDAAVPVVRRIIRGTDDVESIMACLRVFKDAADLDTVRGFLDHPRWEVRVRAVAALGRMGTAEDAPRLMARLSDPEWWVRYRSAQALSGLPGLDRASIARLQANLPEACAREMLAHVMAERRAA